jgi:Arylsulfotransferase (ASST)
MADAKQSSHRLRRGGIALGALAVAAVALLSTGGHSTNSGSASGSTAPASALSDLRPPRVTVLRRAAGLAPGLIFLGAKDLSPLPGEQGGPLIIDHRGRPVWFKPLPPGRVASDFRVQRYRGRPVLTWWQGRSIGGAGHGDGEGVLADSSYHVIARVHAGDGYRADQHSFRLTPQGTGLITAYHETRRDLSSVGGARDGKVYDSIVQEIDVATGRVLLDWHSLDHVPLGDSYEPVPKRPGRPYDYFHVNSVSLAADGNLLISGRHTWTIYEVDRHTGQIIWRLGGKQSDFRLGTGVRFAWQHDPVSTGPDTLRIFDNESNGRPVRPSSRIITVRLDRRTMTATLVRSVEFPGGLSVPSQGDSERLSNGDLFVGWGRLRRLSEFAPDGRLLFDARLPPGYDTYRAYCFPWTGHPTTRPAVAARRERPRRTTVDAAWNGASDVARWRILAGPGPRSLRPVATVAWKGLETAASVATRAKYVSVSAEDALGHTVGRSGPVRVAS